MNPGIIITIIGIFVAAVIGFLIPRQIRLHDLNRAVQKTIDAIRQGESCRVIIFENFSEHKRLANRLLPYLLFVGRSKTEAALKDYQHWYDEICYDHKRDPLNTFGKDSTSDIDMTLKHLINLQRKI